MLVVGDNLKDLCLQHALIDHIDAYDVSSLTLRLHAKIVAIQTEAVIDYGRPLSPSWVVESEIPEGGLELKRNSAFLACSEEYIRIPVGYFGLVQTKGSLARLFVSVTCNDGQIDPGFCGRITFELVNLGNLKIRVPRLAPIAQLYIFRTSTKNVAAYSGRYLNADKPTIFVPKLR